MTRPADLSVPTTAKTRRIDYSYDAGSNIVERSASGLPQPSATPSPPRPEPTDTPGGGGGQDSRGYQLPSLLATFVAYFVRTFKVELRTVQRNLERLEDPAEIIDIVYQIQIGRALNDSFQMRQITRFRRERQHEHLCPFSLDTTGAQFGSGGLDLGPGGTGGPAVSNQDHPPRVTGLALFAQHPPGLVKAKVDARASLNLCDGDRRAEHRARMPSQRQHAQRAVMKSHQTESLISPGGLL